MPAIEIHVEAGAGADLVKRERQADAARDRKQPAEKDRRAADLIGLRRAVEIFREKRIFLRDCRTKRIGKGGIIGSRRADRRSASGATVPARASAWNPAQQRSGTRSPRAIFARPGQHPAAERGSLVEQGRQQKADRGR